MSDIQENQLWRSCRTVISTEGPPVDNEIDAGLRNGRDHAAVLGVADEEVPVALRGCCVSLSDSAATQDQWHKKVPSSPDPLTGLRG